MCKLDSPPFINDDKKNHVKHAKTTKSKNFRLLFTIKSFELCGNEIYPNLLSFLVSGSMILLTLCSIEYVLGYILYRQQSLHPLLLIEVNRQILARHVGVDALSCFICCLLGYHGKHLLDDIFTIVFKKQHQQPHSDKEYDNDKNKAEKQQLMHTKDYGLRLFRYHPEAFRVSFFFFWYQVKNTYDTIIWNDGPEFIFHHVFSIFTAYGAMIPGCGHMYAIFFFGLSELSTSILCLLANFDDIHGVPGLGEAFPPIKACLGILFALNFILFRCILWPIFAYYFVRDVRCALRNEKVDIRVQKQAYWLRFFLVSLTGISFLQVAWLGQIFVLGKQEFEKMGYL